MPDVTFRRPFRRPLLRPFRLSRAPLRLLRGIRGPLEWAASVHRLMPSRNRMLLLALALIAASPYSAPVAVWGIVAFAAYDSLRRLPPAGSGRCRAMRVLLAGAVRRSRLFPAGTVLLLGSAAGALAYGNPAALAATLAFALPAFAAALWYERTWTHEDALHFSHSASTLLLPIAAAAFLRMAGAWPLPLPFPDRATGTFGNPNVLAFALELVLPMAMAMFHHVWSRSGKRLLLLSIAVGWVLLYSTGSRSGLLAALAGAAVFFLCMSDRRILTVGFTLAAVGLVALAVWPDLAKDLLRILIPRAPTVGEEIHNRIGLWRVAWDEIVRDPLLGRGFYSFHRYAADTPYADRVHAHNLYLGLWLDAGGIALAAFLLLGGRMGATAVRSLRASPLRPHLSGCLAGMASLAVHGVTDMPLMNTQSLTLFLLSMAAMSVVLGPRRTRAGK